MRHLSEIQFLAERFLSIQTFEDLLPFLQVSHERFMKIVSEKRYNEFFVNKPRGGQRLIEDPVDELQDLQSKLNVFLQAVYHINRSKASYAFQWTVENDQRNIRTNALQHFGNPYMIKVDFENYFHQIDKSWFFKILRHPPFRFKDERLIEKLSELCLYKGRLPMGAPTSPVLANLALHPLDKAFETLAFQFKATYTRFADDMIFSSKEILGKEHLSAILQTIQPYNLKIKDSKTKLWGMEDQKVVTGIILSKDGLELEEKYLYDLSEEVKHYFKAKELAALYGAIDIEKLKKHEQKIEGHINFIGSIYGKGSEVYLNFVRKFEIVQNTSTFQKVSWLDFNNYAFFNRPKNDPLY